MTTNSESAPGGQPATSTHEFDVALSFAGEQRGYVEQVAGFLKAAGVRYFYDNDEDLWGEELVTYLDRVYRHESRFCLMFISVEYAAKMWTGVERRSAVSRAAKEMGHVYILPVRFDDTDLPGLQPTIAHLDARFITPQDVCARVTRKVRDRTPETRLAIANQELMAPAYGEGVKPIGGLLNRETNEKAKKRQDSSAEGRPGDSNTKLKVVTRSQHTIRTLSQNWVRWTLVATFVTSMGAAWLLPWKKSGGSPFLAPIPCEHPLSLDQVLARVPSGQRDAFESQAELKTNEQTETSLRVDELATMFFEVPASVIASERLTDSEHQLLPGFIKIQVISYSESGTVRVRALYSQSTEDYAKKLTHREVYKLKASDSLEPVSRDSSADGNTFKADVQPGERIVVVVSYVGCLVDGKLGDPENGWRRDWHMVEVSDYAAKGAISYVFGTGGVDYPHLSLTPFDFGRANKLLWFCERNPPDVGNIAARLTQTFTPVVTALSGMKNPFAERYQKTFAFLSSKKEGEGISAVKWAGEQLQNQQYDKAYITKTQ